MPNQTLARRYATAVYQLAWEEATALGVDRTGRTVFLSPEPAYSLRKSAIRRAEGVQRDLHTFVDTLRADRAVSGFFRSPVVDRAKKEAAVAEAFASFDPIALHTILFLIRKRRESLAEEIVEQYDVLDRTARGAQALHIATARTLSDLETDRIVARLENVYQTTFDVSKAVDPSLIGGIRVTTGDRLVDGTIAGRLDDIARLLSTN
jgi:F-type H+-transporting ATPase subunit delta